MSTATPQAEVHYPSGDGQPMAETPIHVQAIVLLHQALEDLLLPGDPEAFIASDIFWYFRVDGVVRKVSPDVMVVPQAGRRDRRSFFSWEERVPVPACVFEVASESTWEENTEEKYGLYQGLGVREYFLFDPEAAYLPAPLLGHRLRGGRYSPMRPTGGVLRSRLGFHLRSEGTMLRLLTPDGNPVPTRAERAEYERVRADEQFRRAEGERERADQERTRADQERTRADTLRAENERLKELLKKLGHANGNGS